MSTIGCISVRVYLLNDDGDTWYLDQSGYGEVDDLVSAAEADRREETGDDSWTMTEWHALVIPRRYAWLLSPHGGRCKLCAALGRNGDAWEARAFQARHLAAHRNEKITNDVDPEAAVIAAATERTTL